MNEAILNLGRSFDLAPSRVTVEQLVTVISPTRRVDRGAKTIEQYRRTNALYIISRLGDLTLAKPRAAHVGEWIAILMKRVAKSLKAQTLVARCNRKRCDMPSRFAAAHFDGERVCNFVSRDVCESVSAPTARSLEAKPLPSDEIAQLLFTTRTSRWATFVISRLR
jgi:hypothetical protein